MLLNDTWFMYDDAFLNAGGQTTAERRAAIDADKKAKEDDEKEKKEDPAAWNLKRIVAQCNVERISKYCKGMGKGGLICENRIKGCIREKMKQQGKSSELEVTKSSDKQQKELMDKIGKEEDGAQGLGSSLDDSEDSNMTLYAVGGIGALVVFGLIGYLVWKRGQPAA